MNLLRTGFLNGIAVFIKMAAALVLNKVFAVTVGPAGYTVVGQLQNAVTIISNVGACAISNGVIKYTAQHSGDDHSQATVWQTAVWLSGGMSLCVGAAIALASIPLAHLFLADATLAYVFVLFGLSLPAIVFNGFLVAVLNGKKEIGRLVMCNIAGSLITLVITGLLTISFGLRGALAALGVNQAVALTATWVICRKLPWLSRDTLLGPFRGDVARQLLRFAAMMLVSAVAAPLAQIAVRTYLTQQVGATETGYWQASWKMSEIYLMLLTTTLATYFLPRFAEITSVAEVRTELKQAARILLPLLLLGLAAVYFLRELWIPLLFSADFRGLEALLPLQLAGDFFKMIGWLLGYLVMAKSMTRVFIVTEIVFSAGFFVLTAALVPLLGLKGAAAAHMLNYVAYCVTMTICLRKGNVI
ncbi:Lipid III flippase [compost metagenome]